MMCFSFGERIYKALGNDGLIAVLECLLECAIGVCCIRLFRIGDNFSYFE